MQATQADELGLFQPWDQAEYPPLLGIGHLGLEPDHAPQGASPVVLPELYDGIRALAGAWVGESDRFHRAKGEGVFAPAGHLFHRQAPLEIATAFKLLLRHLLSGQDLIHQAVVFLAGERAVEVILAMVIARGFEGDHGIDGLGSHYR